MKQDNKPPDLIAIRKAMKTAPARRENGTARIVDELRKDIEDMRKRGHSLSDVAALLKTHGVNLSARSLARNLASVAPRSDRSKVKSLPAAAPGPVPTEDAGGTP